MREKPFLTDLTGTPCEYKPSGSRPAISYGRNAAPLMPAFGSGPLALPSPDSIAIDGGERS